MGRIVMVWTAVALLALTGTARAMDPRELVAMPADVQEDMLTTMRDHLMALDTVLSHVASERYAAAADLAVERFASHSFDRKGAERMAAFMPQPMRDASDGLREAAGRFAVAARAADAERSYRAMKNLAGAISDITATCDGCHAHYRIR